MTNENAEKVLSFMDTYTGYYRELSTFEAKKQTKIVTDDVDWLLDSLDKEQAYIMAGSSYEKRRLKLFEDCGIKNCTLNDMIESTPDGDLRARMKMVCTEFNNLIMDIKRINKNTEEIITRKMQKIQNRLSSQNSSANNMYNGRGGRATVPATSNIISNA